MKQRKIIAIVGLPGSGKTEAINYLIKKLAWPKVYFGDATFEEMANRGLSINEKNERMIREELRVKHGVICYALWAIKKIKKLEKSAGILVESLYSLEEYLEFKKAFGDNFLVLAIYSPPRTRYARLAKRKVRPLTLKECQSRELAQIVKLKQSGPITLADWTVLNITSRQDLFGQLDKIINEITDKKIRS
jgi:dephospho-CoA kinase